ncbi:TPA: immunity protein, partial [Streptococcus suis]
TEPSKKETTDASSSVAQSSSEQATDTSYKVGDTIVFKDVAEITITNIAWTDERNTVSDIVANKVLLVTY